MHAENFLVNQGSNWQAIEYITEYSPESDGVAALALIVEAVDTVDLCALVISAEQEEILWVLYFVA